MARIHFTKMASQPFRPDGQQHHSRLTTDDQAIHSQHYLAEEWYNNPQGGAGTMTPEPSVSRVLRLQVILPAPWSQTPPAWTPQTWLYSPPTLAMSPPTPRMSPPAPSAPILSTPQLHISNNTSSRGYFRNCIGCFKHAYCLTFSDACKDHAYCRYCFNHFVRLSCGGPSNDEDKAGIDRGRVPASASTRTFPPRCCGQPTSLPDDALRLVLEADVLHLYMLKRARSRLPLRERTHCAAPDCGMWLTAEEAIREDDEGGIWMGWKSGGGGEEQQQQQQQDQGVASRELRKCSRCAERTCTACKQLGRGHLDGDGRWKECPVDEEAVQLESMADGMKWTRCGGCGVWVELSVGCRHVVCHCGYEFCFRCGSDWMACPGHRPNPAFFMANEAQRNTSNPNMRGHPMSSADPFRPPPMPSSPVIARTPRPPARSTAAKPPTPTGEGEQDLNALQSLVSTVEKKLSGRTGYLAPASSQEPLYFGTLRSQLSQSVSNNHRTISRLSSLRERDE